MTIRTDFPHAVREIENTWIPLADGTRLAARIWLPETAEAQPVPAVLEYLPYRKDDANLGQYSSRHPYFAGFGYAGVCVDLRGTGDSDGILLDEYLRQEQDDALEVIAWLAEQPWCNGSVGMIGYSWGGFNGLQVAARKPPALKAVVTMYSTDDRYADDCHYMGGCLLGSDMLKWATWMRLYNALPPDPRFREDWREVWLDRLANTPAYIEPWVGHQVRDGYWRQGSVCEDYAAIEAATLVVGGWTDAYTNAVPRLLENLSCERRGIIGPWAHTVPNLGVPGPAIGFLQECLRWFGRWLKDEDTGVEDDPFLRVWLQDSLPPADYHASRPGRWLALDAWPAPGADADGEIQACEWRLDADGALRQLDAAGEPQPGEALVAVATPQHVGESAGVWCANGMAAELAIDQADDDAASVCWDSAPLDATLSILGFPLVRLALESTEPLALVAVRLCEVAPDGASTLLSWGQLNLTHRNGHEQPEPLEPGKRHEVDVQLNAIGQRVSAGNRLRIAISSSYWPHSWPSPRAARLTVYAGPISSLELPLVDAEAHGTGDPFGDAEVSANLTECRKAERSRVRECRVPGRPAEHCIHDAEDVTIDIPGSATTYSTRSQDTLSIRDDDPLSAVVSAEREGELIRGAWRVRVRCEATMSAGESEFLIHDTLRAWEGDDLVFSRTREITIPRDGV